MRISYTFGAELRGTQGKGASRRLRHSGKVPAILYGAPQGRAGPGPRPAEPAHHDRRRALLFLDRAPQDRRAEPGGHRQGRADAPGQAPGGARRPAARRREREDPHPPADPLQGRDASPGREDAGRRGLAHARRRRDQLPAEGPARVPASWTVGDEPQRDQVPVGHSAAGRA